MQDNQIYSRNNKVSIYTDSFVVTFKIDFELFTLSVFMVERILSGIFCPLTAPLKSVFDRSAPFSALLTGSL